VESIEEHLRKQRLRWFGHMERVDCERPQSVSGVARVLCALGQEIFLRPLSTKTTVEANK